MKLCAKTFTEAMEAAEVPESTTKLITGHAMTYGRYSKGQRVQPRAMFRTCLVWNVVLL